MTSVEADISSPDDVDQRYLSSEPLHEFHEFLTLEELFAMTRVEQLKAPTLALLKARFSPEEVKEAMIGFSLMEDLHFGRKRRSGAEEGTHPALVGLMDLLANSDLTVDQLVTDYLHDVIEDCEDLGITARHVSSLLMLKNYPKIRAEAIAVGVEGLTRNDHEDQVGYTHKIATFDKLVPHLYLRDRKAADTTHTVLSYSREIKNSDSSAKAKKYLDRKALLVLTLGEDSTTHTPNTQRLRQAIIGCNDTIAQQNQHDQVATRLAMPHVLFTARVRV